MGPFWDPFGDPQNHSFWGLSRTLAYVSWKEVIPEGVQEPDPEWVQNDPFYPFLPIFDSFWVIWWVSTPLPVSGCTKSVR